MGNDLGIGPLAPHSVPPTGIVILTAMHLAQPRHDAARPVGIMQGQPLLHQRRHLLRQAEHDPTCAARASIFARCQDRFKLGIGQGRHHGRGHDAHGHARLGQPPDHCQTARRRRGARLHQARQVWVQRRYGNAHTHQTPLRHTPQNVEVTFDQRPFGHDGHRMATPLKHLQTATHDLVCPLYRLIRVRIGADGQRRHFVRSVRQFRFQHLWRIGPRHQPGFKIQPRRQPQIGVTGPGKAIDTAMFAPAIRIDRPVKGQIGRAVVADHAAGPFKRHFGAQNWQFFIDIPAIRLRMAAEAVIATDAVCNRPPTPRLCCLQISLHRAILEQSKNKCQKRVENQRYGSGKAPKTRRMRRAQRGPCRNLKSPTATFWIINQETSAGCHT
mmetsp:Transcript_23493/g.41388  ORF Transcript_23493/g.41388 Transcript_23493/m.41388 type:complete len:385 (+) Transcript_23493:1620-2774(+)